MSDLFKKLAAEEKKFFSSEFLSPVMKRQSVQVRIAGIVLKFKIRPRDFEGWGVFKTIDQKTAELVREATVAEKREYLKLYPRFSLIVCQQGEKTLGFPAQQTDNRLIVKGLVPIHLPQEVRLFQTVHTRFDGERFWYEGRSTRSPKLATVLREYLAEETKPEDVTTAGLNPEEKKAYEFAYVYEIESKRDKEEDRIKDALIRAGADYRSYVERGATYMVEYMVDGQRHRSVVDKETLEVSSAGICLNNTDSRFDLQSLVSVIREAQDTNVIYRVGDNQ